LTEEQRLLRDAVRELADERVAPRAAAIDRTGEFPEDLRQLLATQDILALPFPEEYGGSAVTAVGLPRGGATEPGVRDDRSSPPTAGAALLLAGTPEQQARWFPKLASGGG
jgi:alkylation response protein AidB-like acyl-CoA dehydrogenase